MTHAPEKPGQGSTRDAALRADDGGDGDHMVRIGRMAHPKEESHGNDGEKATHGLCSNGRCRALKPPAVPRGIPGNQPFAAPVLPEALRTGSKARMSLFANGPAC